MATHKKIIIKDIKNAKNIIIDPHGRYDGIHSPKRCVEEMPYNAKGPLANIVNHCRLNGSSMSACYACQTYTNDGDKIQCQKACNFFQKHSFAERCTWETYGEYCWSTKAQDQAKIKGF